MWLMSLGLLLANTSSAAGTAIWLTGTPDLTATPDHEVIAVQDLVPDVISAERAALAHQQLEQELTAAQGLKDVFDGELSIIRRLETALDAIRTLNDDNRELVVHALLLQGSAVHRYYQTALGTDPAAAPHRLMHAGQAEVRAWADALALAPDLVPTDEQLIDPSARLAYQEFRARILSSPASTIQVTGLTDEDVLEFVLAEAGPFVER